METCIGRQGSTPFYDKIPRTYNFYIIIFKMASEDNDKVISPASVPSLAETSYDSSSPESQDDEDRRNTVFVAKPSFTLASNEIENIEKVVEDDQDSHFHTCASTTSSEMTVVTKNMSTPEKLESSAFPSILNDASGEEESEDEDNDDDDEEESTFSERIPGRGMRPTRLVFEEPPEVTTTSCNNALSLTPKQLADIFLAFEGAQRIWPPNKQSEEVAEEQRGSTTNAEVPSPFMTTDQGWTQRAESLERECIALKKIIQDDSSKLLNLRSALEAQRDLTSMQHVELAERSVDLQIAEERLLAFRRESEEFRERESELVETINILKTEVDTLTRFKSTIEALKDDDSSDDQQSLTSHLVEMEQMKSRLELFSMRISEQHTIITELRKTLQSKEEETKRLQSDLVAIQAKRSREHSVRFIEISDDEAPNDSLAAMLLNITKRLEAVENGNVQTERMLLRELKQKDDEINQIRLTLVENHKQSISADEEKKDDNIQINEDPDSIEVIPSKVKQPTEKGKDTNNECCCGVQSDCDVWSAMPLDDK